MNLQELIDGVKKIKADAEAMVGDASKTTAMDWANIFHQALEDVLQLVMNHVQPAQANADQPQKAEDK